MDNVVALLDVGEVRLRRGRASGALAARCGATPAEDLGVGQQVEQDTVVLAPHQAEPLGQTAVDKCQAAVGRHVRQSAQRDGSLSAGAGVDGRDDRVNGVAGQVSGRTGLGQRFQRADEPAPFAAP